MLKFKIVKKDYKDEDYEAPFTWNDIPLKAIVRMHYHTFLHWWGASYDFVSRKPTSLDVG